MKPTCADSYVGHSELYFWMPPGPFDPSDRSLPTAVLPVAVRDLDRAAILLQTVDRFSLPVHEVRVVVPDHGRTAARARLACDLPLEILTESELLGGTFAGKQLRSVLSGIAGRDWYMQQIIKLAATSSVERDWCLLLDADALVTRNVAIDDLFDSRGRARVVRLDTAHNPKHYRSSARLLRLPQPDHEYGVTPLTLHRETCRAMLDHLEAQRGADWFTVLSRRIGWTEFSLYFVFSDWSGATEVRHAPQRYEEWFSPSVWEQSQWADWNPDDWFGKADSAPFSVVQSHTRIATSDILDRLQPWIGR